MCGTFEPQARTAISWAGEGSAKPPTFGGGGTTTLVPQGVRARTPTTQMLPAPAPPPSYPSPPPLPH